MGLMYLSSQKSVLPCDPSLKVECLPCGTTVQMVTGGAVGRELTTQYLPFGRLGFKTAEQFVLAATDVCKCERTASGELLLLPVCDDTTSHVRKMVEKSRRPRTSARVCQGAASTGGGLQRGRRDLARSRPRAPVSAPAEVRRTALELLSLHPQVCDVYTRHAVRSWCFVFGCVLVNLRIPIKPILPVIGRVFRLGVALLR